jgi:hypothetical protein
MCDLLSATKGVEYLHRAVAELTFLSAFFAPAGSHGRDQRNERSDC